MIQQNHRIGRRRYGWPIDDAVGGSEVTIEVFKCATPQTLHVGQIDVGEGIGARAARENFICAVGRIDAAIVERTEAIHDFPAIRQRIAVRVGCKWMGKMNRDFLPVADGIPVKIHRLQRLIRVQRQIGIAQAKKSLIRRAIHFVADFLVISGLNHRCPNPLRKVRIRVGNLDEIRAPRVTVSAQKLVSVYRH